MNVKQIMLFLLLVQNILLCQQDNFLDSLFIGQFYTFAPYSIPEDMLREIAPEFNSNQIFIWAKQDTAQIDSNWSLLINFADDRLSGFRYKLYWIDLKSAYKFLGLSPNDKIYYFYKGEKYNGLIKNFYYFDGWIKGYFIGIDAPKYNIIDHSFEFFPIVASTNSNLNLLFDQSVIGQNNDEVYQFSNYSIESQLKWTGRINHYDGKIYKSKLTVKYKNREVYQYNSESKLYYMVGNIDNGSSIFLYIYDSNFGRYYTLVHITKEKHSVKNYAIESVE